MLKAISGLCVSLVAIAGCANGADATETPVATSTQSATATPTASSTVTPAPSLTPQPSPITTPTATPSPTPVPVFIDSEDCASISAERLPTTGVTLSDGSISVTVEAEVADSPAERSQGLMCRSVVPEGTGMLFVFEAQRTGGFWMFNTYVPLDIIYFNENGQADIVTMLPCPRDDGESEQEWRTRCAAESSAYQSDVPFDATLELPHGWLESQGFDIEAPGDISITY